jgi:hypothetical protein
MASRFDGAVEGWKIFLIFRGKHGQVHMTVMEMPLWQKILPFIPSLPSDRAGAGGQGRNR